MATQNISRFLDLDASTSTPSSRRTSRPAYQGIFWILTVPQHCFVPYLPDCLAWIRGQLEIGDGGFVHWQIVVAFKTKTTLRGVRQVFGPYHADLTRSAAAETYVWKDDTAVAGTRFSLGVKPIQRNSRVDWDAVWNLAVGGDFAAIPSSIRVQSYRTLRAISSDYARPSAVERRCFVYWGTTGTGKSRLAWESAGLDAYPKDPRTKFWCGYRDHQHVVIDEFRGGIDIAHLLRWLDRYPVIVEVKGGSQVFVAKCIWITSNLPPNQWYPECDAATLDALLRRLEVTHFSDPFNILP